MFYGDESYKEPMRQLLFQIIFYNFRTFEVSLMTFYGDFGKLELIEPLKIDFVN